MNRCIYCHAASIFSVCDLCDPSISPDASVIDLVNLFDDIAGVAPMRPTRTNRWWSPASFFSGPSMLDSGVSVGVDL